MGIKEILAAKAAAAAGLKEIKAVDDTVIDVEAREVPSITTINEPVKAEPPSVTGAKMLSFAEKMALKKQQEVSQNVKKDTEEKKEPEKAVSTVKVDSASSTVMDSLAVMSESVQAYADIRERIDSLTELSEEPLEGAMKELKKALMANPSAVSLMLDEDIGKMVVALRKMTGVAIADAASGKKDKKPKASKVLLTADQLAAAFDEL